MLKIQGAVELTILSVLNGQELHGYLIVKRLQVLGENLFQAGEGTIYPLLAKLEKQGLIRSRWSERRKIYTLTPGGRRFLDRQVSSWSQMHKQFTAVIGATS